jgi:uncharacterized RDD family membrane protein YckC
MACATVSTVPRPCEGEDRTTEMIDTLRQVETPEGIRIGLHAAGALPRARAWMIDGLIRYLMLVFSSAILGALQATGMAVLMLVAFVIVWGYPVLFETLWNGQTPGKKMFDLRVVNANGTPVTWLASITRNLLRTADMLPFGYAIGLLSCWFDPYGRRLGDLAANTLVVYTEPRHKPAVPIQALAIESPLSLTQAERMALVAFAERSHLLTEERQQELAALLPMLTQSQGTTAVQRVLGMAKSVLGRR